MLTTLSKQVDSLVNDIRNLNAKIVLLEAQLKIMKTVVAVESVGLVVTVAYIIAHALGLVK